MWTTAKTPLHRNSPFSHADTKAPRAHLSAPRFGDLCRSTVLEERAETPSKFKPWASQSWLLRRQDALIHGNRGRTHKGPWGHTALLRTSLRAERNRKVQSSHFPVPSSGLPLTCLNRAGPPTRPLSWCGALSDPEVLRLSTSYACHPGSIN